MSKRSSTASAAAFWRLGARSGAKGKTWSKQSENRTPSLFLAGQKDNFARAGHTRNLDDNLNRVKVKCVFQL